MILPIAIAITGASLCVAAYSIYFGMKCKRKGQVAYQVGLERGANGQFASKA